MTRDQWNSMETLKMGLGALLSSPEFKVAVELLKEESEPKLSEEAALNPTLAAALFHQRAGYFAAFRDLAALTRTSKAAFVPTPMTLISEPEDQ